MSFVQNTASGQWWSDTKGWIIPSSQYYPAASRDGRISINVLGSLTNGTVIVVRRRLRSEFNGGTGGQPVPVIVIDSDVIASTGRTGFTDDFNSINTEYEFDVGCPDTFGSGDTVSVEIR